MININRGFRKVSPDDMRGVFIPGRRVTGKAHRQGQFAPRRNWGSGSGGSDDGQVSGPVKELKLVPWVREPNPPKTFRTPTQHRAGTVLGWVAVSTLVQLWLVVILDMVARTMGGGASGWSPFVWPSLIIALVGTQVLGILSDNLSESRCEWGTRALVGFWVSVLVWVPLGVVFTMLVGIFN